MIKTRIVLWLFTLLFLLSGLNIQAADIPMMMNYQGSVTDASGVPVDGDGFFKFALVNGQGDTATASYWANDGTTMDATIPSTAVTIPVSNGRFVVRVQSVDATH